MFYEVLSELELSAETRWPKAARYISVQKIPEESALKVPVLTDNCLIIGTTGYGKTTVTKKILDASISSGKDDFIVFFEIKDDYREYIRPDDKVITYSASSLEKKYNTFKWNMVKECRQADDADAVLDAIATLLFAELIEDSKNRFFAEGAKNIFKGYVKTIIYCHKNCPSNKEIINGMKTMSYTQFISHLMKYKGNHNIVRDYFGCENVYEKSYVMPKRTGDLMAFLTNVLEKFSGAFCMDSGDDTIHDYLAGKYGKRLFLIYDYSKRSISNLFFRFFLQRIIEERLAQNADISKHMILMLDESPALEGEFGLMDAVTIGRGRNLQIILSTQSIEKLYCISPEKNSEHITRASLSGYPTIIAFHPSDMITIELIQQLFGTEQKLIQIMPMSRYGQVQSQYVLEPKVSNGEFSSLGVGECYIKIKDAVPIRVKIKLTN